MLDKFIARLKAQYWFYFVREKLIFHEINDIKTCLDELKLNANSGGGYKKSLSRIVKLEKLTEEPLTENIYSYQAMSDRLLNLNGGQDFGYEFSEYISHFKCGLRPLPDTLKKRIDRLIPGSKLAHDQGPQNLFSVLEAYSLPSAVWIINQSLLDAIESHGDEQHPEFKEIQRLLNEYMMSSIFSGVFSLLENQRRVFNILFPENKWDSCTAYVRPSSANLHALDTDKLLHSNILPIHIAAPIAVGFAFIRAKYLGEEHFLARVCFEDQFLKILNVKYMMKEDLWLCSNGEATRQRGEKYEKDSKFDGPKIRQAFQSAKLRTTPLLFSFPQSMHSSDEQPQS
ncbi:hypothetical protein C6Y40_02385 [Alteromonas alba]|uniref:Uncharacterized protein n=1 Tax=Alteromonas alba TaxID=2079529 RepID=A0A2S9VFH3_9ALTE|nr:hypothetical protein [Alteromonas alba]PRO75184.1 hypothetical protein C6Y40_02385 [Alteromonas alba]